MIAHVPEKTSFSVDWTAKVDRCRNVVLGFR
jgi:hypothetical protein